MDKMKFVGNVSLNQFNQLWSRPKIVWFEKIPVRLGLLSEQWVMARAFDINSIDDNSCIYYYSFRVSEYSWKHQQINQWHSSSSSSSVHSWYFFCQVVEIQGRHYCTWNDSSTCNYRWTSTNKLDVLFLLTFWWLSSFKSILLSNNNKSILPSSFLLFSFYYLLYLFYPKASQRISHDTLNSISHNHNYS